MMRRMIFSTRVAVLLVILAVSSGGADAGTVEHHGAMVDSEGYAAYCRSCHAGKTEMYMPDYIKK